MKRILFSVIVFVNLNTAILTVFNLIVIVLLSVARYSSNEPKNNSNKPKNRSKEPKKIVQMNKKSPVLVAAHGPRRSAQKASLPNLTLNIY